MLDRLSVQPTEIDKLPWHEFLHYRNKLAEKVKAENDAHKRSQAEDKPKAASKPSRFRMPKMNFGRR